MERRSREAHSEIEKGLASKGRLRIIAALAAEDHRSFSRYMLERRTGIRSNFLDSDLMSLVEVGWVTEHREAPAIKRYTLNRENEVLAKVLNFLRDVGYTQ